MEKDKRLNPVLAFLLAPVPLVILGCCFCVWVINQPVQIINGVADDAPRYAAGFLLVAIPFAGYSILLVILYIQLLFDIREEKNIKQLLIPSSLFGILITGIYSFLLYRPEFGESYLTTFLFTYAVWWACSAIMSLTWLGIVKVNTKK